MSKNESILLRLSRDEKAGFQHAAEASGLTVSAWMRERLRLAAVRELEGAGVRAPFVPFVGQQNGR